MDDYGTHQPILLAALKLTDKPVLEIGAGESSTRIIHENYKGQIITIDDNREWLAKYMDLKCKRHKFTLFPKEDYKSYFDEDDKNYGVVFIDSSNWDQRMYALMSYKDTADYIVIHDSQGRGLNACFKSSVEFTPVDGPATIIGSNLIALKDMDIKDYNKKIFWRK